VFAFDRDAKRLARLEANAAQRGATCIAATCTDFLAVDPREPRYARVAAVLLDPSCSGSGTFVSRMDHLLPLAAAGGDAAGAGSAGRERVESLARFQEACLRHALHFPALRRLVYSTCSVHRRENEDVVAAALPEARAAGFELEVGSGGVCVGGVGAACVCVCGGGGVEAAAAAACCAALAAAASRGRGSVGGPACCALPPA
jgi:putative methyltransferase